MKVLKRVGRNASEKGSKILHPACYRDEKALLISENSTENWEEGEKQDRIVCRELFTNVTSQGQIHTLGKL